MSEKSDRKIFGIPVGNFSVDTSKIPDGFLKENLETARVKIETAANLGAGALTDTVEWAKQTTISTADTAVSTVGDVYEKTRDGLTEQLKPLGKIAIGVQDITYDLKRILFDGKDEPRLGDRPTEQSKDEE